MNKILKKISDPHLRLLLESLGKEEKTSRKEQLLTEIKELIHSKERDAFLARFAIKDFDDWLQVLDKDERSGFHSADFYAKPMLEILLEHKEGLEPKILLKKVLQRIKDKLSLADFCFTPSMRIRYDSMMRTLVESKLKKWKFIKSVNIKKKKKWTISDRERVKKFLNNKSQLSIF